MMKLYRQSGQLGVYQLLVPVTSVTTHMPRFYPANYAPFWTFLQHGFGTNLISEEANQRIAELFFEATKRGTFPTEWVQRWSKIDAELTQSSKRIAGLDLTSLSPQALWERYQAHLELDLCMWGMSAFIDGLDSGWDQIDIEKRRVAHDFSHDEVQILLTPQQPSYMFELDTAIATAKAAGEEGFTDFHEHFWWAGTNYSSFEEVTPVWLQKQTVHPHPVSTVDVARQQQEILRAHGQSINPLEIFQTLAIWRDDRKRLNYTGLYGLCRLLNEGLHRLGIETALLTYVLPTEVEGIFKGIFDEAHTRTRKEAGVLMHVGKDGLHLSEGPEACREYERLCQYLPREDVSECKGMVACRGSLTARARVVPLPDSPSGRAFQPGEVLITSMTRPEFLPLMKKAGAIVTDEGGISCHAAIVSRELNIPCVIGTKIASKIFKDGDMVEVDAEKGIVKKL